MKSKELITAILLAMGLMACHNGQKKNPVGGDEAVTATGQPADTVMPIKKDAVPVDFFSKGTIESVSEVAITSRINEQIVMLGVEMGQRVQKGQVVARLDRTATEDKIVKGRAELERAEYQYQNILMGQGYKRGAFDQAPENIREMARINSGYNTAKASLQQLEHQLSYCTITAPITGAVSRIEATLYGAATPGVPLFYMVDTEHLKVCFDVLESEFHHFQVGMSIKVVSVAYPSESHSAIVSAISPVVEKNGMVHIEALLTPHPHLMPGMTAIVTLAKP